MPKFMGIAGEDTVDNERRGECKAKVESTEIFGVDGVAPDFLVASAFTRNLRSRGQAKRQAG